MQTCLILNIMKNAPQFSFNDIESPNLADRGVFDSEPMDEDDLWFLPGPDPDADTPEAIPLPRADVRPLVDVAAWRAAEATLVRPLADLALRLGGLAARLESGPAGWRHRLALQEATDLSWLSGDRVPLERLALWMTLRLAGDNEDAQALARAGWAARRLQGGLAPADDLAGFLGRPAAEDAQIADWQDVIDQAQGLHPICRAALGFHIWPVVGLSAGHVLGGAAPVPLIEAAVVAARSSLGTNAPFVPLALGGAGGLRGAGAPLDRLQRWIAGADHATRKALSLLNRMGEWEAQTRLTCATLSGRTPGKLITVLRDWPLVSAPMAEAKTGASRAAVQRNLNWMAARGLIRETTGQGRYRFWTAQL